MFLKAYFAMVIEAKELQQEVKDFLASYHEILENIHADYWAQTTGNYMRDASNLVPVTLIIWQTKTGNEGGKYIGTLGANGTPDDLTPVKFLSNMVQLLPLEYYS